MPNGPREVCCRQNVVATTLAFFSCLSPPLIWLFYRLGPANHPPPPSPQHPHGMRVKKTNAINFFVWVLKTQANFQNPRRTTSGRKVTGSERNKEYREKSDVYSGHCVLPAMLKGSACTSRGPISTCYGRNCGHTF
jgi:hypothetical protein